MKRLGQYLRKCRTDMDLSQQQVADKLKIDRSAYTYYETGKVLPNISRLLQLSKIFNTPCIEFINVINNELGINAPIECKDVRKN